MCADVHPNPGPDLSMCHLNAQSISPCGTDPHVTDKSNFKLDEIHTILANKLQFDVITASETWLDNRIPDTHINIEGYTLLRKDRVCDRRSGGVCAYVKETLPLKRRTDLENDNIELLWLEIDLKPIPILIGICYRPHGQSKLQTQTFLYTLHSQHSAIASSNIDSIYLLGDFNDRATNGMIHTLRAN